MALYSLAKHFKAYILVTNKHLLSAAAERSRNWERGKAIYNQFVSGRGGKTGHPRPLMIFFAVGGDAMPPFPPPCSTATVYRDDDFYTIPMPLKASC